MSEPEQTLAMAEERLRANGEVYGVPFGIDWMSIIDAILAMLEKCREPSLKSAVERTPAVARLVITKAIRQAMPGASMRDVAAVRETIIATVTRSGDDELAAFSRINV